MHVGFWGEGFDGGDETDGIQTTAWRKDGGRVRERKEG